MSEIDGQDPEGMSDLPEDIKIPEELKKRAQGLFSKGSEVAYALQYDYAIEMFLDGIAAWPTALDQGHKPLRDIALKRQAGGGKKSGLVGDKSKFKNLPGKSPRENMLKAEYLLSKDPNNSTHMTNMIKSALRGDFKKTAFWMANILFDCNIQAKKPSLDTYKFLIKSYKQLNEFAWAVKACTMARQMKPNDNELNEAMRDLSAQATMQKGKYDEDSDFRESIQDRQSQEDLQDQELHMRSHKKLDEMIAQARKEYLAEPIHPGKVNALIDILCEKEDKEQEDEAYEILEKAYAESEQFHFKKRAGELKIKQHNRNARNYKKKLLKNPDNPELKNKLQKAQNMALQTELEHYQLCIKNYPTDQTMKFEYAKRLMRAKKFDDAIPLFQDARSNPRYRLGALSQIGQCFFYKKWYAEAVGQFLKALELVESQEGQLAKELRYNLARAYEADDNIDEAIKNFSRVAQIDFNYLDVRKRVDELRKKQKDN